MNLEIIPKIGPKAISLFNKMNIFTVQDLLEFYPSRYNVIKFVDINNALDNELVYIKCCILSACKVGYIKRNFNRLEFIASSNNTCFKVVIFNRAFLKNSLTVNKEIVVVGKYKKDKNTFTASDIKFNLENERIEVIYHLTEGLKNSVVTNAVMNALKLKIDVVDNIPDYLKDKYKFISKMEAINKIHNPMSITDIKQSELRLIYEELFVYMFKLNYLKSINKRALGQIKEFDMGVIEEFLASLNFQLTVDQEKTIQDILDDMKKPERMNRLVLGDVGSGKTIVAIVAILANFLAGYQSTFMAPTEILSKQHYVSIKDYFKNFDIKVELLTGSTKAKEKKDIYSRLGNGDIDVIIGTHALLNDNLNFNNLGLVITDEQHRFGVNQRNILQNKGTKKDADVIYLSATPIPRTYALTIFGDLDMSQIKTKPSIRKEVITKVVSEQSIKDCLLKMLEEIKAGHQIFVVSPLIMQNDELNLNSVVELKDKLNKAFSGKVRIEIIHGKLKQKEKDMLMEEFKNDDIKILISTTVIEVGIDIPNASMMVIFNAERFGLATLHQLRGRVGRSDIQSYCYLISNNNDNDRLKVMEESSDGFYIAEADFEQRGQGDLFGIKQSGDMNFKIANLRRDFKILEKTNVDAREYIENKSYVNNDFYMNIIKDINFLD